MMTCLLTGLAIGQVAWAHAAIDPPRIQRILICGNERTTAEIIRRELLFAEGDLVDSSRIAETERNLRRLFFIGEVDIRIADTHAGSEVTVEVEDLYSRALSPLISGQPNELSFGLVGLDYNLFGRGQSLRFSLEDRAISGPWADLLFAEPRLRGSRHALSAQLGIGSEGHAHLLALSRPFATLADRHSYGISLASRESVQRLYSAGQLDNRYRDELDSGRLWAVHSYGHQTKIRPSLQLNISRHRFAASKKYSYAPANRKRITPSIGLLVWRPTYNRDRFIRDLGPIEDLQMGSWLSLRWGFAHTALGSDRTFSFYQAQLSPRFKPTRRSYALLTFFASTRIDQRGYNNLYALASIAIYSSLGATHSLAFRLSWEALHRSEDASQLLLGLERGLRGFAPRRFDGTRRLSFNIEGRPTLIRNPWYTLAGSAFVDCGTAWTPGANSPRLEFSPGIGLRFGFPKVYNTPVFRGDIAYGAGSLQLSVGMGQYF